MMWWFSIFWSKKSYFLRHVHTIEMNVSYGLSLTFLRDFKWVSGHSWAPLWTMRIIAKLNGFQHFTECFTMFYQSTRPPPHSYFLEPALTFYELQKNVLTSKEDTWSTHSLLHRYQTLTCTFGHTNIKACRIRQYYIFSQKDSFGKFITGGESWNRCYHFGIHIWILSEALKPGLKHRAMKRKSKANVIAIVKQTHRL